MHKISKKKLREFWQDDKDSEVPLDTWYRTAKRAEWENLAQVREDFSHADLVGKCIVFNIGGNKYRLITKIEFLKQQVFISSLF